MSYDLFFVGAVSEADFRTWFQRCRNFQVHGGVAGYTNQDTGVSFHFERAAHGSVAFNMNYIRPHFFGLEAEPHVSAFRSRFDLGIQDPQQGGMGEGPYSPEGFLKGWSAGNAFGIATALHLNREGAAAPTLPTQKLRAAWFWTMGREKLAQDLGGDVFVPKVIYLNQEGAARTAVVWGDGVPIALPEVDLVLVPRFSLAPRRWLGIIPRFDQALVPFAELGECLSPFERREFLGMPYRLVSFKRAPEELRSFLRERPPLAGGVDGFHPGQILDRELVEKLQARLAERRGTPAAQVPEGGSTMES